MFMIDKVMIDKVSLWYFTYRQSIPWYEHLRGILGANWFITEWYPSKQLVWPTEDDFFMAFTRNVFVRMSLSFS